MNRTIAPEYRQAQDLELVFPEKIKLDNGAIIYWLQDVKDESVKLDIEWNAGSKYQDKILKASFTNKMLLSGSGSFSAGQIAEELDFYGGYSQTEIDKDHAGILLFGLRENIAAIFDVFTRAFEAVEFPETELAKEKDIALNKFRVESQKVKTLCRRAFTKNLFGSNAPYGQVADEEDFKALSQEDLRSFFKNHYHSAPAIFLTGNVDLAFVERVKNWAEKFPDVVSRHIDQPFDQVKGRVDVPKTDAIQTAIRVGRLMFKKDHPDYFQFQFLNTILGGYFGSRLMANIREDKGYTYGIGSGMAVLQDAGYFFVATEVGKDVKEDAVKEIYNELEKLKIDLISDEELTRVKNYMLGEFLRLADGPLAMMEIFKNLYYNQLPDTYYSDYIKTIHATTPQNLQTLAKKYFVTEEMLEVVAG